MILIRSIKNKELILSKSLEKVIIKKEIGKTEDSKKKRKKRGEEEKKENKIIKTIKKKI